MRVAVFDLETSGFSADGGIILCYVRQEYQAPNERGEPVGRPFVIRADHYKTWSHNRSNDSAIIRDIMQDLTQFDIIVAHNGEKFDKLWLNSKCLEYRIDPLMRQKKSVDPVKIARKHLRLGRNTLAAVIDYLGIPVKKTPLELKLWRKAFMDGNKGAMNKIVAHCVADVRSLVLVYDRFRPLIGNINTFGSWL